MENENVLFTDGALQSGVSVTQDGESVWLSANQMAQLFDKGETNIRKKCWPSKILQTYK